MTSLWTLLFGFGFSAEGFTSVPGYKNHSHQAQGCYLPFSPAMNTENAVPGHREGDNTESTKCILLPFPDLFQLICCHGLMYVQLLVGEGVHDQQKWFPVGTWRNQSPG